MQDLSYTYDPVGNITHIQDDADIQNVVFFRNQRVEPSNDYTYDAIYRLIQASGREQLGLDSSGQPLPPTASSYNDVPRVGCSVPATATLWEPTPSNINTTRSATSCSSSITAATQQSWMDAFLHLQRSQSARAGNFSNRLTSTGLVAISR